MLGAHYSEKCMDELLEKMDEFLKGHSVYTFMVLVTAAIEKRVDAVSCEHEVFLDLLNKYYDAEQCVLCEAGGDEEDFAKLDAEIEELKRKAGILN